MKYECMKYRDAAPYLVMIELRNMSTERSVTQQTLLPNSNYLRYFDVHAEDGLISIFGICACSPFWTQLPECRIILENCGREGWREEAVFVWQSVVVPREQCDKIQ